MLQQKIFTIEQDYEQLTLFPEDSHASHFPWLESKKVKGMTVTSGRKCSGLSEKLSRLGYLVRTYLESCELPGKQFVRTWSVRDTLLPYLILKLRLSVLRTGETGCSLWRTPDAHCDRGASSKERMQMKIEKGLPISLNDQIAHPKLMWPTPTTRDYKDGTVKSCENVPVNGLLGRAVHLWPTPRAGNPGSRKAGTGGKVLAEEVKKSLMWRTPMACDHKNMKYANQQYLSNQVQDCEGPGSLYPVWVEWLMGFPTGWTDIGE